MRIQVPIGVALLAIPVLAQHYEVPLRVDPPQSVKAITVRGGDVVRSVEVRGGKALVPQDVPLPWTLALTRFEPVAYTRENLAKREPLLLRELGILHGELRRATPPRAERITWLLRQSNTDNVDAVDVDVAANGRFELRFPAGVYEGAALGTLNGTRIRSGIVIQPGKITDLGVLLCEPVVPVSLRVIDGRSGAPVSNARVIWDPPQALNANAARVLYAKRWTTGTDSRGMSSLPAVGPLPIPVRWRVEAAGYATQWTAGQLMANVRAALPDVRLQREPALLVRVRFVRKHRDLNGASIVIAEPGDPRTRQYVPVSQAPLREGELRLAVRRYGPTRILIESAAGKPLLYRDLDVDAEGVPVDLALEPIEIHGKVTRRNEPVQGTQIWIYDPQDSRVVLAKTTVDDDGEYSLSTWQSGELEIHALEGGGAGRSFGPAAEHLTTDGRNDYRVDFDLPAAGVTLVVVDSSSRAPLKAQVEKRIVTDSDVLMGWAETDDRGRLVFSGYSGGNARFRVMASGHRARELEVRFGDSAAETVVALEKSEPIAGRVVDAGGAPVAGARVTGGYRAEDDMQAPFIAETDANGRFELDAAPDPGTPFYIAAARHALGIVVLQAGRENVIVLHGPSSGVVSLRPGNAFPTKTYLVVAMPAGGRMIPFAALSDLADVNGITPYQLQGSQKDGSVVLPQFLQPGTYDLFLAHKGGQPFLYERVGAVTLPMQRNVVLAYESR